jgi:hypothetical protein
MIHAIRLVSGMIALLIGSAAFGAPTPGPAPAAVFPQSHFEFGNALEGPPVAHDFIVHNTGDADLQIERIKTG